MVQTKCRLGELLVNFDYLRKPLSSIERDDIQGEYPYYGAQGIIDHINKYCIDGRYLLIAEDGENLSSRKEPIAIFADGKYWVNNHAHIVRTNDLADINYIMYTLNHMDISGYVTGSAQPKLSQGNLNKITLLLPPLPTQQKIASILSAYDSQIENNQKRIKLLEQMAENLYKEWFVRFRFPGFQSAEFEGGVPKGWNYKPLGEVVSFERGLSYSSEEIDCEDGLNLVNLKNIEAFGGYRRDGLKHYNGKYKTAQVVKKGDLVMGVTDMTQDRRTVGAVALIPEIQGISVISADLVKIVSKQPNLFLYCLCRYGYYSKFFSQFANGANVLHLKPNTLLNKKVLMPTDSLIKLFAEKVQASISCIDDLYQQTDLLTTQRDLLLPRLMSGKLEVKGKI